MFLALVVVARILLGTASAVNTAARIARQQTWEAIFAQWSIAESQLGMGNQTNFAVDPVSRLLQLCTVVVQHQARLLGYMRQQMEAEYLIQLELRCQLQYQLVQVVHRRRLRERAVCRSAQE